MPDSYLQPANAAPEARDNPIPADYRPFANSANPASDAPIVDAPDNSNADFVAFDAPADANPAEADISEAAFDAPADAAPDFDREAERTGATKNPTDFDKPSRKERRKYDWDAIENEYVTADTFISTRTLAEKYNIPYPTLRDYAARHDWDSERKRIRSKIVADAHKDAQEVIKNDLTRKEINARATLFQLIEAAVEEWQNKPRASLGDLAQLLKLGLAAQGETTERTASVEEQDFDDYDIIRAAESIAARSERKAEKRDFDGSAASEDGRGAGWTD